MNERVQEELFKAIELIADRKIAASQGSSIKIGVIKGVNHSTYNVAIGNATINCVLIDNNLAYDIGEKVYVLIQNNTYSEPPIILSHLDSSKNSPTWKVVGLYGNSNPGGSGGGGGSATLINKTITANGTYIAAQDHADGYRKVDVNVPIPQPDPPNIKSIEITENGTYIASSDIDGYSPIVVNVPQPQPEEPILITKEITQNGNYNASNDNADGYKTVSVSVPEPYLVTRTFGQNGTYRAQVTDAADGYEEIAINVPSPELLSITITQNGTYTPPSGAYGYNNIIVNCSESSGDIQGPVTGIWANSSSITDSYQYFGKASTINNGRKCFSLSLADQTFTTINNRSFTISYTNLITALNQITSSSGEYYTELVIGGGTAAVQNTDIKLASPIGTSYYRCSEGMLGDFRVDVPLPSYFRCAFTIYNSSSVDLTVNEVGLTIGNSSNRVLVARAVLDSTITIPGNSFEFFYMSFC